MECPCTICSATPDQMFMCEGYKCHPKKDSDTYASDARLICLECAFTNGVGFSEDMTEDQLAEAFWICERCDMPSF
jgi:hypothetical protein